MRIVKHAFTGVLTVAMSVAAFTAVADDDKWAAIQQLEISPAQAVGIAAAKEIGNVIELDLEFDDGRPYYDIEVQGEDNKHKMRIDANNGEIVSDRVDKEFFKSKDKYQAEISMQRAITIAERETGARVKEAELKDKRGKDSYYELTAVSDKEKYEIKVDANTGDIIKMEKDD